MWYTVIIRNYALALCLQGRIHQVSLKGDSTLSPSPSQTAPLCPISRNGLGKSSGAFPFLCVCLFLASVLMGVGLYSLPPLVGMEDMLPLTDVLATSVVVFLVIYMWRLTRSARAVLPILLAVGGFLSIYMSSILPAALLCGTVFILGVGSTAIAVLPKDKLGWIPLLPLAAYGLTALLSLDPLGAVVVLIPWPAAVALAWGTRRSAEHEDGPNRVGVICLTAVAFGLTLLAYGALNVYRALGTLDPAALGEALESLREEIVQSFLAYEIPVGIDPELEETWKSLMTYSNLRELVNSGFNLLPGVTVAVVLILVSACQAIQHAALRTFGYEESITARVKEFCMSLISCIVFLVAYLLVFLENSSVSSLVGTVATNVVIILMPGLALAGMLRTTRGLVKKGAKGMGCLFFFIILIPCLLVIAPFVLAAVEVIGNIASAVIKVLNPPDDDPFGQDGK